MKKWKVKLPVIVGGLFLLSSLPFILGYLKPSIHEGGYSAIYVLLNIPALMVVSGVARAIETEFIRDADLFSSNMVTLVLVLLFWLVVAFLLGTGIDIFKRKRGNTA